MSLENDARRALREAILAVNGVDIRPDQFSDYKPSDRAIGAQDGAAWLTTLDRAAAALRSFGHSVADPTIDKATELREATLTNSRLYLQELAEKREAVPVLPLTLIGLVAVLLGIFALRSRAKRTDTEQ